MSAARFFVDPRGIDRGPGTVVIDSPDQVKQITAVLRLRQGDRLDLLDNGGSLFRCEIERLQAARRGVDSIICRIIEEIALPADTNCELTIAIPLLRSGRFEWAVEKLTELGVSKIVPLYAKRTVVQETGDRGEKSPPRSEALAKVERWQSIAREASEQCERAVTPHVVKPMKLADFIECVSGVDEENDIRLEKFIAAERSQSESLQSALRSRLVKDNWAAAGSAGQKSRIVLLLGPEGGFTEEEIGLSFTHGFQPVTLGPRILRVETAALYSASLIMALVDNH